jgi:hypothetical protein
MVSVSWRKGDSVAEAAAAGWCEVLVHIALRGGWSAHKQLAGRVHANKTEERGLLFTFNKIGKREHGEIVEVWTAAGVVHGEAAGIAPNVYVVAWLWL